jgi:hypothetical protein
VLDAVTIVQRAALAEGLVLEAQHARDVLQRDRALVLDRLRTMRRASSREQSHQVLHQQSRRRPGRRAGP